MGSKVSGGVGCRQVHGAVWLSSEVQAGVWTRRSRPEVFEPLIGVPRIVDLTVIRNLHPHQGVLWISQAVPLGISDRRESLYALLTRSGSHPYDRDTRVADNLGRSRGDEYVARQCRCWVAILILAVEFVWGDPPEGVDATRIETSCKHECLESVLRADQP